MEQLLYRAEDTTAELEIKPSWFVEWGSLLVRELELETYQQIDKLAFAKDKVAKLAQTTSYEDLSMSAAVTTPPLCDLHQSRNLMKTHLKEKYHQTAHKQDGEGSTPGERNVVV